MDTEGLKDSPVRHVFCDLNTPPDRDLAAARSSGISLSTNIWLHLLGLWGRGWRGAWMDWVKHHFVFCPWNLVVVLLTCMQCKHSQKPWSLVGFLSPSRSPLASCDYTKCLLAFLQIPRGLNCTLLFGCEHFLHVVAGPPLVYLALSDLCIQDYTNHYQYHLRDSPVVSGWVYLGILFKEGPNMIS